MVRIMYLMLSPFHRDLILIGMICLAWGIWEISKGESLFSMALWMPLTLLELFIAYVIIQAELQLSDIINKIGQTQ